MKMLVVNTRGGGEKRILLCSHREKTRDDVGEEEDQGTGGGPLYQLRLKSLPHIILFLS